MDAINQKSKHKVLRCAKRLVIFLTLVIALVTISSIYINITTLAASSESIGYHDGLVTSKDSPQLAMSTRSMLIIPNSNPMGYHDGTEGIVGFGNCDAFGWAVDLEDAELDVTVRILSDGIPVATTVADEYRGDVDPMICPEGTCGFGVWLWGLITPGIEHQISAQAYDQNAESWIDLAGTPKSLTCWGYPEGVHDGSEGIVDISECIAFGWAFDPDDYSRDVTVQILSDGIPVATTVADEYRGDINPMFCPEGTCGFSVNLWRRISPRVEHQTIAQVYDQETDSWINLDTASLSLTCMGSELFLPAILQRP
jgi:hypothetical protein